MCDHDVPTLTEPDLRKAKDRLRLNCALVQGHVIEVHGIKIVDGRFQKIVDSHVSARVAGVCDGGNIGSKC